MIEFSDFVIKCGGKRVCWEWIGEGNEGDYNPDDPEDTPLLRFSCDEYLHRDEDGYPITDWSGMEDASYCTQLPVTTPKKHLAIAAVEILEILENVSYKRDLERMSWLCSEDFTKNP